MPQRPPNDPFARVKKAGLTLPEVEASIRYDGSPVLKLRGVFVAALASHPSAEPATLVVRSNLETRDWMLLDAPETYYLTDYYRKYPLVLARLSHLSEEALRDLLTVSWKLASLKTGTRRGRRNFV